MVAAAQPGSPTHGDTRWDQALERVVAGGGLRLAAQPIIDVARADIAGHELLARFEGPPAQSPDVWFAAARHRGRDAELTVRVLAELHRLRAVGQPGFCTVNVEPHLLLDAAVLEALLGAGRLTGVVVELTEHVEAADDRALDAALDAVREAGGLVAMDDAGTGYAGLAQMLRIRPDIVKLDRGLVAGLDLDPVKRTAVRLVGELAGEIDAWLLAEGVETRGELAEVVRLGVPLVQGWAVGRPADGWSVLDPGTRAFIAAENGRLGFAENVVALVRPAAVRSGRAPAGPWEPGTVLLDDDGRPRAVVVVDPAGVTHRVPALTVAPSSAPDEVLRRALARPAAWHAAPVVCTDSRGVVLGVLEIRDLVERVVHPGRTAPSPGHAARLSV
ncbi:EAL domain-containing protein [Cellulomonas fimi]|uniref:EAL domain-containing protein n=1 Tax=Cellulomonas fimi TaxID=1708 RepID=A0A7Y0QGX9_CELFI|nr:EAL domain-containing protein [Cellulomonas fimi]NMR19319.1 EAL domain-containing protein [Cellulomonas fimi]